MEPQPDDTTTNGLPKGMLMSVGVHAVLLVLLTVFGQGWARAEKEDREILVPIAWVFTEEGSDAGTPAAAGGKKVRETPSTAQGSPGGENAPAPPANPIPEKPLGEPAPPQPNPAPVEPKPGTIAVPEPSLEVPEDPTVPAGPKGDPNGVSGRSDGTDEVTSGEQDHGGGPTVGAGYGGPGFNGPARSKEAQNYNWSGKVVVTVTVTPDGGAAGAKTAVSSGIEGLDAECARRVGAAPPGTFTPALKDGKPVQGTAQVTCDFPPLY